MTTISNETVRCACCGTESEQARVYSTNRFGPPDLDLRPPEMERSTMHAWVACCPACGYCGPDLSEAASLDLQNVVQGEEYRAVLGNPQRPRLANLFLCEALLDERRNDHGRASRAWLRAAWSCDDAGLDDEATRCRLEAASHLEAAMEGGSDDVDHTGGGHALLADLYRRAGHLEQAAATYEEGLAMAQNDIVRAVLLYERSLCEAGDRACHTVADAVPGAPS